MKIARTLIIQLAIKLVVFIYRAKKFLKFLFSHLYNLLRLIKIITVVIKKIIITRFKRGKMCSLFHGNQIFREEYYAINHGLHILEGCRKNEYKYLKHTQQ